jgi:hypothetical protein
MIEAPASLRRQNTQSVFAWAFGLGGGAYRLVKREDAELAGFSREECDAYFAPLPTGYEGSYSDLVEDPLVAEVVKILRGEE